MKYAILVIFFAVFLSGCENKTSEQKAETTENNPLQLCKDFSDKKLPDLLEPNFVNDLSTDEFKKAKILERLMYMKENTGMEVSKVTYFDYFKELNLKDFDRYDIVYKADLNEAYDDAYLVFFVQVKDNVTTWVDFKIYNSAQNLDLINLINARNAAESKK